MGDAEATDDEAFRAAVEAWIKAYERIERTAENAPGRQRWLERAVHLVNQAEDQTQRAYEFRDRAIAEIWEAEKLSLAKLAGRVGISKARADQIVREQTGRPVPPPKRKAAKDGAQGSEEET
jgi:hypothetical protein